MFDIAFSELVVIGVVALIVIGPEKLPKVARTVGLLVGRVQRYVNGVKSDISRELRFEELQRLQDQVREGINQAESAVNREVNQIGDIGKSLANDIKPETDNPVDASSVLSEHNINDSKTGKPD